MVAACSPADLDRQGTPSPTTPPHPTSTIDGGGAVEVTDDADLYAVPDPIPQGEHGDLLRYQRIESGVDGAAGYRVMYLSESVAGEPIVVTGMVFVPTAPAPDGGRPVLAVAHGTTGIADACAPSRVGGAERSIVPAAVERGWIVTITDYEGLGTPGRHPYLVGESEGRSVIDSVHAARWLPGAERGDATLIAGYSQGGHGALWAAQVADEWGPDLDVVGTFAGAPATELHLILGAAGEPIVAGFAYLLIAGFAAAYPEADPSLVLTERGVELLDVVDDGCVGDVFRAVVGEDDLVRPGGPNAAPWPELAARNNPGQVATDGPVLIVHSAEDEVIIDVLSEVLFDRMCDTGQHAERRVLEDGGTHGEAAAPAFRQALAWFDQLIAGEDVADTCR